MLADVGDGLLRDAQNGLADRPGKTAGIAVDRQCRGPVFLDERLDPGLGGDRFAPQRADRAASLAQSLAGQRMGAIQAGLDRRGIGSLLDKGARCYRSESSKPRSAPSLSLSLFCVKGKE